MPDQQFLFITETGFYQMTIACHAFTTAVGTLDYQYSIWSTLDLDILVAFLTEYDFIYF
jgi:hypothetical protein